MLKKLQGLPVEQCMVFKTATLVYKFLHFLGILLHVFLPTAALTVPGSAKMVVISWSFQNSTYLFINLLSSLVIVLLLMLPLFGMI